MIAESEMLIRVFLSLLLGGIIGFERELDNEPAGIRTHMLVCLGATLFTVISISIATTSADSTRIAAGIVSGIGFLGAGAIFRGQDRIKGLTTAADLWVLAAIGMAVGVGYYLMAIVASIFLFIVLFFKKIIKIRGKRSE